MDAPVYNPALPYSTHIHGGFSAGRLLRFQGIPHPSGRCFSINLQCGGCFNPRDDVALHLSPVFSPPPRIVRNSLQMGSWGPEESHGSFFPVTQGQPCEILVLAETSRFMIAINGEHFCEFYHRIPLNRVCYLNIDGEVTVTMVKFEGNPSAQMPYEPQPPYAPAVSSSRTDYQPYPTSQPYVPPVPTMGQQPYVPMSSGAPQPYVPMPTQGPQFYPVHQGQSYPTAGPTPGGYYPGTTIAYPKSPSHQHKSGLMAAAAGVGTALAGAAVAHKMHKKSSPIPIGLGLGAGALGAAALMGHSPFKPKKLKKLYKHKHFKHKHKWGWKGHSSSSSSDE